mgnify:FL=1
MANYVEVKDGVETMVPKSKGRTRLGWVKGADGNYRLDPNFDLAAHKKANRKPRSVHYYITVDANGVEVSRTVIGKGRPHRDFKKNDADGNFYRHLAPQAAAEPAMQPADSATETTAESLSQDASADSVSVDASAAQAAA